MTFTRVRRKLNPIVGLEWLPPYPDSLQVRARGFDIELLLAGLWWWAFEIARERHGTLICLGPLRIYRSREAMVGECGA